MGGTGALWRPIAAGLEDEMQILALDQRGHGSSRITQVPGGRLNPGFTPLDYGQDIIDTLDSLHFHPTWIVGHSMGVRSAVAAAHLRPEWFQGLILIDLGFAGAAGGGLGDNLAQFIKILPQEFESRENAREFMTTHCPDPSITQYLMAVSVRAPSGHIHFPFDHSALIQTIAAAKNVNVREWVKELGQRKIPICILRGQNSLVWSRQEFEAEKDRFSGFPSIQFIEFPQAGHGLPFEQRPAFVQYLKDVVLTRP
jgi:pimeloyl-ACP methyl ester carboxylesterase